MVNEIVVTGTRPLALRTVRSIADNDLRAYGAGSVGELLDEVMNENGDGSSALTILVDGKRVTGLGDIDGYPAEALARIDILAREGGAAVGAPAGSRVYNIVLKPQIRLGTVRGRARGSTVVGMNGATVNLSATRIRRPQRLNLAVQLRRESALLESERGVAQPEGSPADLGSFRTLRPRTSGAELTFSAADRLTGWLDGLVTLKIGEDRRRSRLGLGDDGIAIARRSHRRSAELNGQVTAEISTWQAVIEAGHRRERRAISTDAAATRRDTSIRSNASSIDLLAFGPLIDVGTGPLTLSLGATLRRERIGGRSETGLSTRFDRDEREYRMGVDVPLLRQGGRLGALSVRAELKRGEVDGATTGGRSLSLRWAPSPWLDLSASENRSRTPAGAALLAEPVMETEGVRFFDPLRSGTIDVVTVTGGLDGLPGQSHRMRRIAADLRPVPSRDLLLTAEYLTMRTRNVLAGLPAASAEVFGLFPDRFSRDEEGRLTRVDLRPVVFPAMSEDQLRLGGNLTLPLRQGSGGPRAQVSGSYRLLLRSRLDAGLPGGSVDLLSRSAFSLGANRPRHQFDLGIGYSERGLGLRLSGERRSATFLDAAGQTGLLVFEPLTTFSLRAFVEGSRLAPRSYFLSGSRFALTVNNLGNERERVRDSRGLTPLAFQPALRDPSGRTIEIEFRKTF